MVIIVVGNCKFDVLYTYMNLLTPTKLRSISMTLQLTFGRFAMAMTTYCILFMNMLHMNPLIFVLLTESFALICCLILPDTFGWKVPN